MFTGASADPEATPGCRQSRPERAEGLLSTAWRRDLDEEPELRHIVKETDGDCRVPC